MIFRIVNKYLLITHLPFHAFEHPKGDRGTKVIPTPLTFSINQFTRIALHAKTWLF